MTATDTELTEVCARLAVAHDLLIMIARDAHRIGLHSGDRWTVCDRWPCVDVGRVIGGKMTNEPTATTHTADQRRAAIRALQLHHEDASYDFDGRSLTIIEDSLDDLAKIAAQYGRLQVEGEDLRRQVRGRGEAALTINLALPDRGLCGNGKAAKAGRSALIAVAREAARLEGTRAHRIAIEGGDIVYPLFAHHKVAVVVTVKRDPLWSRTKLDDDNLQRGLKPYLDGLQDAMIVATDRQFYFDGPVKWEKGSPLRGGVTLQLYPTGEDTQ